MSAKKMRNQTKSKGYKKHLFICTFTRESGRSCGPSGGQRLRDSVKAALKNLGDQIDPSTMRINASGCLGKCEQGIAAVCYPEGQWFLNLDDSERSCEQLLNVCTNQEID